MEGGMCMREQWGQSVHPKAQPQSSSAGSVPHLHEQVAADNKLAGGCEAVAAVHL